MPENERVTGWKEREGNPSVDKSKRLETLEKNFSIGSHVFINIHRPNKFKLNT